VQAVEVDEDLLRHVFRLISVGEDAVGDGDHTGVFRGKEAFERLVVSSGHAHAPRANVHH
jgi:hypothetical protein